MGRKNFTQSQYRWLIFIVLSVAYILVYFHRLCAAVVAVDMMNDLKAGGALLGLLGAAYFYPYALMQLPAGLLSDSWGPRKTITLFFLLASAGSILLAFSPTPFWAIMGRTMVGIGVAMLFVPTMKVLAEWFRSSEFATMTGFLIAMGGVGTLISTSPLALLSREVGWRYSFVIVGVITLALALCIWVVVRDRPSAKGWDNINTTPLENPGQSVTLLRGVRQVLTYKHFWPVAIWFFFDCSVFFTFGGLWGGPYLMHIYGLSKTDAGNILSMLAAGMIVGSPFLSFLSNSIVKRRKPVIVAASLISVVVTLFLAFYTESMSIPGLYLLTFAMGVCTNAIVVIGFTVTKELYPVEIAGTSTGLVNLFPFAGGAVFQPLLGFVLEQEGRVNNAFTLNGYKNAFFLLFLCSVVAFLASIFFKETLKK